MKTHWSIQKKLITSFLSVAAFLGAIGGANYYFIKKTLQPYERVATVNVPNLLTFIDMMDAQKSVMIPIANLYGGTATHEEIEAANKEIDAQIAKFEAAAKQYDALPFVDGEQAVWAKFKAEGWKPFIEGAHQVVKLSESATKEDNEKRDLFYTHDLADIRKKRVDLFRDLMEFQHKSTQQNSREADTANHQLTLTMWSLILAGSLLALLLGYFTSRQLSRVLGQMTDSLSSQSDSVSAVVTELASASQELSAASTEQAAALQETAGCPLRTCTPPRGGRHGPSCRPCWSGSRRCRSCWR
ncbi:MAG: hypothetical protein EOP09_16610 [Proteobacteria bacterium]|nr:MAG: hypothetical protein EOP09_16610 [Pseudomonadota bacterium]